MLLMRKRQDKAPEVSTSEPGVAEGLLVGAIAMALVQLGALALGVWGPLDGTFSGPDSYMRLHRIVECWGGVGCSSGVIAGSNAPYGDALHWPWLWDWFLIGGSLPLRLFWPPQEALHVAAYLSAPIMGLATIALLTMLARRLGFGGGIPFVGLLLVTQPYVIVLFSYARPDHHGVQAAVFALALVGACHTLLRPTRISGALTGVGIGIGLWISTEGLVTALPLLAALGFQWVMSGDREAAKANLWVAAAATAVCVLALALDGPQAGTLSVEYDRLSVVHSVLFGLMAVFWALSTAIRSERGPTARWTTAVAGAAVCASIMALLFPGFWGGPAADFPPELWSLWLDHTAEYVPLVGRIDATEIMMATEPFLYGLPLCIWGFLSQGPEHRRIWLALGLALVWFQGLATFEQVRWEAYVHLISTLPLAWGLSRALGALRRVRPSLLQAALRVGVVCSVAIGPVATSAVLGTALGGRKDYAEIDACGPSAVIEGLSSLRGVPDVSPILLAPIFWGPEVLYRTGSRVVATPYHRNEDGIMASHRVMSGTDAEARAIILERGITHIAICPNLFWLPYVGQDEEATVYGRLVAQDYPPWIRPLPADPSAPSIQILEIDLAAAATRGPSS